MVARLFHLAAVRRFDEPASAGTASAIGERHQSRDQAMAVGPGEGPTYRRAEPVIKFGL